MKHSLLRLSILALLLTITTTCFAYDFEIDGIYYNILSNTEKTVEVTHDWKYKYENQGLYQGNITIPTNVTYQDVVYTVIQIGESAFYDCDKLLSVAIPNSIESIGEYAFSECSLLTNVLIPSSVRTIGDYAFYSCYGLKSVTMEEGITHIGKRAVWVYDMDSLILPNSVKEIGDEAFSRIHYIVIGSDVEKIGRNFVDRCDTLKFHCSINWGFGGKLDLKKLILDDGVKTVCRNAFYGCHIDTLVLGNTIEEIKDEAFWGCGIKGCVFPNSLKYIGYWSFANNYFKTLIIPPSIEDIRAGAFGGNRKLEKFTVEDSDNTLSISYQFAHDLHASNKYVLYIGRNLSCDIYSLFDDIEYVTIDTLIFGDNLSKAWGCKGLRINNLQLSKNTKTIENGAFANATIPYIEIPNSVMEIEQSAFDLCNCDSFSLGNSIEKIGRYSFKGTGILKRPLIFPETLKELRSGAFQTTYSKQSIVFTSLEPPLIDDSNIFSNPYSGAYNTVYVPNESFEKYMSKWNLNYFQVDVGPMNILMSAIVVGYNDISEIFDNNGETHISTLINCDSHLFNIYDTEGKLVRQHSQTIKGLPNGVYIINGRKILVK